MSTDMDIVVTTFSLPNHHQSYERLCHNLVGLLDHQMSRQLSL